MDQQRRYRPQLDELEDRSLPNNLFSLGGWDQFGLTGSSLLGDLLSSTPTGSSSLVGQGGTTPAVQSGPLPGGSTSPGGTTHTSVASPALVRTGAGNNFAGALAVLGGSSSSGGGVVSPQFFSSLYSQLSAQWWQYALSVPTSQSPFLDQTGANFAVGQPSGNVLFLSGTFCDNPNPGALCTPASPATAVRNIVMPTGKYLFFPILNTEQDNLNPFGPNFGLTISQLRDFAAQPLATAENLSLQIDGKAIPNLANFRVTSPVFSYTLPANNIISFAVGAPVGAQTVYPAVADGYYALLSPLSQGAHTIRFTGDFGPGNFALDVTYHITVLPPSL
jgi:hypothetical protein